MPASAFSLWISLLLFLGHRRFFAEAEPLQGQRGRPEIQTCFWGEMPAGVVPGPGQNPRVIMQASSKGQNDPKLHQRDSGFSGGKGKSDRGADDDESNSTDGDGGSNSSCTTSELILRWPLS